MQKLEKKKVRKGKENSRKKKLCLKVAGDALGVFLDHQRLQKKIYRGGYDQKKKKLRMKIRNDGSIRN